MFRGGGGGVIKVRVGKGGILPPFDKHYNPWAFFYFNVPWNIPVKKRPNV